MAVCRAMRAEIVSGPVLGKTKTMMLRSACKVFIAFGCVWFCFGFEALVKSMGLFGEGENRLRRAQIL